MVVDMNRHLPYSDVVASLSHALDLTEGQPAGHAVRTCLLGMDIARELGLPSSLQSDLYYALLLKDAGCSANAAPVAAAFGADDHPVKRALKTTDWSRFVAAARYAVTNAGLGKPVWRRIRDVIRLGRGGDAMAREFTRIRCHRGAEIAEDLGFSSVTSDAIRSLDEHWDGGGHPEGVAGHEIPLLARICSLAQTVDVFLVERGVDEALAMVHGRRGRWFDPELADIVLGWRDRTDFWARVRGADAATDLVGVEPADRARTVGPDDLDGVAEAYAEIIDAKSPFTYRHSLGVAEIARALGVRRGVDAAGARRLYRAGLLHDIGKLGVSNRILDKPAKLTDEEFARVRTHPRHTLEVLRHVDAFADLAKVAAFHHERLDGRGYPWGLRGDDLDEDCRTLAVADVFEALTASRPYRDATPVGAVLEIMRGDAGSALDGGIVESLEDCVDDDGRVRPAVLQSAAPERRPRPGVGADRGLTLALSPP
jgi:HD-GYP domain-containing protein (c-di-GMP phosphodiesterase class II)